MHEGAALAWMKKKSAEKIVLLLEALLLKMMENILIACTGFYRTELILIITNDIYLAWEMRTNIIPQEIKKQLLN